MAPRGRSRRAARTDLAPEPTEEAGQPAREAPQAAKSLSRLNREYHIAGAVREEVLLPRRCSFLMPVPEQLMPFMEEAGFGHAIQLRDFAFDAPLLSAFVERWRPETHTFCLPWGCGIPPRSPYRWDPVGGCMRDFQQHYQQQPWDMVEQYLRHVLHLRKQLHHFTSPVPTVQVKQSTHMLIAINPENLEFEWIGRKDVKKTSNILDRLMQWASRGSMFKKGHTCLMPMYINVPQQSNNHDCAIFVMKWMEELDPTTLRESHAGTKEHNISPWTSADLDKFREKNVANILLSPENLMRMDVATEVNEIRLIKPGAALRSPFTQFDSADLKTN
ncbi:hypothetical protein PIB30_068990 [Stylosanthes scabra]|uniref:Ubiquitin-like protease family profile domain-containing protein n=1 Tax=Stylosanthes scabra TaxID=79078 RepID=A0ABU6RNG9_9FABA|nr:hypothetical protein [Stylosanthes scabra]